MQNGVNHIASSVATWGGFEVKDQSKDGPSGVIIVALGVTTLFLVLFGFLLSLTTACSEGWWLWHRLDCLEPNALGDTFAGAFAPVAFVWLVAAVLLQRNELAAQRQELKESRQVATEQVAEARKNVAFIEAQTRILEAGRALDNMRNADNQFEEMLDVFNRSFLSCEKKFYAWHRMDSEEEDKKSFANTRLSFFVSDDVVERTKRHLQEVTKINFQLVVLGLSTDKLAHYGIHHFSKVSEILDALERSLGTLSPSMAAKAVYMGIGIGAAEAREILLALREQGSEATYKELPGH